MENSHPRNFVCTFSDRVLGQLSPRKIAPNPKTNPNLNPNPNWGAIFLERIYLVAPNPKTDSNLDPNTNPNRRAVFSGGNCPDTSRQYFFVVCATEGFVFYVILWFWWKCSFHSLFHLVIQLVFDLVAGIKQRVRKCSMLLYQDRVLCNVNKSFKLSLWLAGLFLISMLA